MPEKQQAVVSNDLLNQMIRFSRVLHGAGIRVNSSNLIDLCQSIYHVDITRRDDFYATARANLINKASDLEIFDQVFQMFWEQKFTFDDAAENVVDNQGEATEDDEKEQKGETVFSDAPPESEEGSDSDSSPVAFSPDEVLMKRDLGMMSASDIEKARKMIAPLVALFADHQSRRYRQARKGSNIDFRRILRRNASYAGDNLTLSYRKKRIRKSRIMLLCDVSGSMQTYSNFFIQFIYALNSELKNFEVAVFSTRMTPITQYLRHKSVEESLELVSDYVHDWAGGTNIGSSIKEFNDKFARDMLRSRTTMLILSDGWDRGDSDLLKSEMKQLSRRVEKLIWLNPLLGNSMYQPLCQGIKTALPFMDYFLPAHSLESLAELAYLLRNQELH